MPEAKYPIAPINQRIDRRSTADFQLIIEIAIEKPIGQSIEEYNLFRSVEAMKIKTILGQIGAVIPSQGNQQKKLFSIVAATLIITACASSTQAGLTGITRSQLQLIPAAELNAQSKQAYQGMILDAKKSGAVDHNSRTAQRVKRVFKRLVPHTQNFRPDSDQFEWEINVIRSNELNAFAMPGGKMAVYSGIVEQLNLTDDEIAAIVGHEMAHVLREHSREKASQALVKTSGISIVASVLGVGEIGNELMQQAGDVAFSLPFSRTMESEADILGLELMALAGYDPNAAVTLWQKMLNASGGSGSSILSTHPSGPERITTLKSQIPKVAHLVN